MFYPCNLTFYVEFNFIFSTWILLKLLLVHILVDCKENVIEHIHKSKLSLYVIISQGTLLHENIFAQLYTQCRRCYRQGGHISISFFFFSFLFAPRTVSQTMHLEGRLSLNLYSWPNQVSWPSLPIQLSFTKSRHRSDMAKMWKLRLCQELLHYRSYHVIWCLGSSGSSAYQRRINSSG